MKKSLIALAVAGAMTVPAIASADATLYGQFRVGLEKADNSTLNAFDGSNRIGVKGTVDLGLENTVGIYQWEAGFRTVQSNGDNVSLTQRSTFAGATGSWGTLIAGRFDHPTEAIQATTDIGNVRNFRSGTDYSDEGIQKTVAYVSPEFNGFVAKIGGVFAGQPTNAPKETVDGYNMSLGYEAGDLSLLAGYGRLNTDNAFGEGKNSKWGLAASYQLDALTLAADYNRVKDHDASVRDTAYAVAATYQFGDGLSLGGRYSTAKETDGDRRKTAQVELGQRLGRGAVAVGYADRNKAEVAEGNQDTFYVSYRLNF